MPDITKDSLKILWSKEKESYRTAEVGSGVQKFCKKVFQCPELFNLIEGKLSTQDFKRKNEFLEEARKKNRRADVVIFIDSDIIIPVEVERLGNIKAGEKQLYNYQADWVKKYGILTDGNEWRFYNNTLVEHTFFIDKILDDPTDFLTFWKEYITPEYYYRSFFEKKGQLKIFEYIPKLDEVREDFFRDITKLIENFKNKLNLKGYFMEVKDETEREKKAVEITYAYLIQFILYKTLVDNSFADFENDWKQRIKSIDKAIKAESHAEIITRIRGISDKISKNIYKRFSDEQEIINKRLDEILEQPKNEIGDVSVWLDILLFINRYNFCNVENEIFGYVYENYLKDLYLYEKKGQYFTDPHVVDFMLDQIGYNHADLKKRYSKDKQSISIIDPSCGSGTFLYNATNRIVETFFEDNEASSKLAEQLVNENIFGLDIAEFPLYLSEMNILMRMLPLVINERYNNPIDQKIKVFKTRDSISEFLDTAVRNTLTDVTTEWKKNQGQMSLFTDILDLDYDSYVRDKRDLNELKSSLENRNKIPRYRFDFVIGNPPYVSYNQCARQHLLYFALMKEGKTKLSDVYGFNLHSVENYRKKYPPKPNLYAFFIALGSTLLKDDGRICYIIPQTLLTESDYDVLRYHLSKYLTIEKIYCFENPMFLGRGIKQDNTVATSSLIFVIKKSSPTNAHQVEIYNYSKTEEDITSIIKGIKKTKPTKIKQGKLLKNFLNWIFIKLDQSFIELYDDYKYNNQSISIYSEHSIAKEQFDDKFYFDVGFILDNKLISNRNTTGEDYELINLGNFVGYSRYSPTEYYPAVKNLIKLPKNCQGYSTLDKEYKIVWGKVYSDSFFFTDRKVLPSMSFTQFIASNHKTELLYLFALLNSPVNHYIFYKLFQLGNEKYGIFVVVKRIKEFTQVPIIDSSNYKIKEEVISQAEKLISLENASFSDYIDFKGILQQKFDSVEVQGDNLVIYYKDNCVRCKIKDNPALIHITLASQLHSLLDDNGTGSISELKNLPVINIEHQKQIKNYIDDLVFALYFKVKLSDIGFKNRDKVRTACEKHKYYKLINE